MQKKKNYCKKICIAAFLIGICLSNTGNASALQPAGNNNSSEELRDLKYQLISAQDEISKLQESNFNLKESNFSLKKSMSDKEKQLQESSQTASKKIDNVINIKNAEIDSLKEKILTYENKINSLSSKIVNINNEKANYHEIYQRAIEHSKEEKANAAVLYYNLAKAYQDLKDYSNAIANYKLALQANSDLWKIYKELGLAYAESGNYKDCASSFNEYLKHSNSTQEQKLIQEFLKKVQNI